MAIFLLMIKLEDNKEKVVYKFGPNENYMGEIEFNKVTKRFHIRKKVNDGIISNKSYERWAAEKIAKIYSGYNDFPSITSVEK